MSTHFLSPSKIGKAPLNRTPTRCPFTSQREEAGLGLYDYAPRGHPRWYDPSLGRFIQPDTIVPNPGDVAAFDRYAYVLNNPLKYRDPTGHQATCAMDADNNITCTDNAVTGGQTLDIDLADEPRSFNPDGTAFFTTMGALLVGSFTAAFVAPYVAALLPAAAGRACADGDCTNEAESTARGSSQIVNFAKNLQGSGNYPGVDTYTEVVLKKGTIIYGGAPGQSNFYTTADAVQSAGGSAARLFQGLQVGPHPQFGYRPGVTAYEVLENIPAAIGKALANPQHGLGGLTQIVIQNYQEMLKPLYSVPLRK